jgi:N-acetylglutamate synthase-like GNAT family acetyltransferase
VQLRVATHSDAGAITILINAAFRRAESFLIDGHRIDLPTVQDLLEKGKFLVAEEDGKIAGCVYVEPRGDRAYLGLLSVDPDRQKAGLGSMLLKAAEDYCLNASCRFIDLQIVNVRQELPSFYHRRGYVETGTAPFVPGIIPKVPCHFVKMSKELK